MSNLNFDWMYEHPTSDLEENKMMNFKDEKVSMPIVSQLKQQLPRVAALLNKKLEDLTIVNWIMWPSDYMETIWRDKAIQVDGLL
jgi:hypothetical protein